jgi:hypothetical protein
MKRIPIVIRTCLFAQQHQLALALLVVFSVLTFPARGAAQTTPAFGPKQYTRLTGQPQTFTEIFQHCGTAPCHIAVINGNADGTKRISSASIFLNGKRVVGPSDFNQGVAKIVKPIVLAEQNRLRIRLASKPGSFLIVAVDCAASPVVLSAGRPGVSLLNPTTLLSAVPIINTGTAAAENVQLTAISLTDGTLTTPASLPFSLGTITAGGSIVLDADFSGGPFVPGGSYALSMQGTYAVGAATYCFTLTDNLIVPPAAPGAAVVTTVTVVPNQISGAPFPPQSPSFDNDVNPGRPPVPIAPFVSGTPTPTSTGTQMTPGTQKASMSHKALKDDSASIVFVENNGLGVSGSTIAEPSGGSNGGGILFVSANWLAAYSTDGGSTFTQLDPTTVFPNDAVGFCCDQIVQYVPSIDRFIWLLQGNGYRLASASPADISRSGGTAWTYWNLTPDVFGQPANSFDFPDLSVGNNYLYINWDASGNRQVARTSLAGLQAGGTIGIDYTDPADGSTAWSAHLTQDTGDEIFWAGHKDNAHLRVFSLAEGSNTYYWRDIEISSWATTGLSSTTPDGQDWLTDVRNTSFTSTLGATRSGSQLWFAWNAGTDGNFQQPHVEIVTLDRNNNFKKIQQVQIWNNSYAFAYPALATDACTGEVGLSLEYGGPNDFENHVVGFWGDFVVYVTTGSNVGTTRFGDYVTIRQEPPTDANPGNLFSAFGYGLNSVPPPATGVQTDIHYVLFGRPASFCAPPPQ